MADNQQYTGDFPVVETSKDFVYLSLPYFEDALLVKRLEIFSTDGELVRVNNYPRKSYGGTPRNTFRGVLIWEQQSIKNLAL